ncbi:MAG: chemotaxis protein CheW [Nitrospirota bacterium]|nr:chemotaxis protein CheW [Nitrospirota bacterium]MDH5585865.1 chemotaxis protein CheW [Nitrospirota bacterium]MDH5773694.1 chemotaxis protein CheW [Nitrospirota bacterium]
MASQQFCTFSVDQLFFGVKVLQVQEVIRLQTMTVVPQASSMVRGLINLRGQIVTAIDLRRRLHLPDRENWEPMNVVIQTDEGAVSLLVDEIGDVLEVSDDVLESPPTTLKGKVKEVITGVYKLEGRLLLVLDTAKAISVGESTSKNKEEAAA